MDSKTVGGVAVGRDVQATIKAALQSLIGFRDGELGPPPLGTWLLLAYSLGVESVRFRSLCEVQFLLDEYGDFGDVVKATHVPKVIVRSSTDVRAMANALQRYSPFWTERLTEALDLRLVEIDNAWAGQERRKKLDELRASERMDEHKAENDDDDRHHGLTRDFNAVLNTVVDPIKWRGYQAALEEYADNLPSPIRNALSLGLLVGSTLTPIYRDFRPETGGWITQHDSYIETTLRNAIRPHCNAIAAHLPGFESVATYSVGENGPGHAVNTVDAEILRLFGMLQERRIEVLFPGTDVAEEVAGASEIPAGSGLTPVERDGRPADASPSIQGKKIGEGESYVSSGGESSSRNADIAKDYTSLMGIKSRIVKNSQLDDPHIGESIAYLKVFERIELFNKLSDEPVVLCGPSRAGKSYIARLIHDSSARRGKAFLKLTASSENVADPTMRLTNWVGYGIKSGLAGTNVNTAKQGHLGLTAGGTIFLDELQALEHPAQELLKAVLDRSPMTLGAGEGLPVVPNVRLIFATNVSIADLVVSGKLIHDFAKRLKGRLIEIPSLENRKDDIPLFARNRARGKRLSAGFLLALLRHTWHESQIEGLCDAISLAVASAGERNTLLVEHLKNSEKLKESIAAVEAIKNPEMVEREVYSLLVGMLHAQGYGLSERSGLGKRLSAIMGISEARISNILRKHGIKTMQATADDQKSQKRARTQ